MANNNNTKNLNVPNLRFPEFKGEWKTAILGDIVKSLEKLNLLKENITYMARRGLSEEPQSPIIKVKCF